MRPASLSIVLSAFTLAACSNEVEEQPSTEQTSEDVAPQDIIVQGDERRILAFGDSLFAGYNLAEHQGYPERLERALRKEGVNARVIDAGVSGDTSAAGRQRLAFVLDQQGEKPDLVMLELGGNDMLRGIDPADTRANFEAMLEELQSRDIPVLLMGMRAPPNYGPDYQQRFDAIYGELAADYDAELVPFWLESIYEEPSLFQSDRIHPTEKGVDIYVLWQGKPLKDADVSLYGDEGSQEGAGVTGQDGKVSFTDEEVGKGINGIMVGLTLTEDSGSVGDQAYDSSMHYLTATFVDPEDK